MLASDELFLLHFSQNCSLSEMKFDLIDAGDIFPSSKQLENESKTMLEDRRLEHLVFHF
jgi:hypothetical protein